MMPLLSTLIMIPLIGAVAMLLLPRRAETLQRGVAFLTTAVTFALSLGLWFGFDRNTPGYQFMERFEWIPSLGITYIVGIDGISLLLILLTTLLMPICILASWDPIKTRIKEYYFSFLLLEAAMIGVFAALDLFLFYVFWESVLIPMYFLIGIWGGKNRLYAAIKFFLYTLVGSLLMLIGILYLYFNYGHTFDLIHLSAMLKQHPIASNVQIWLFAAFSLAFAIKVPMFPFHTWLPDAHTEAPTAGSIILAGVLLKMGTYGFVRFSIPLFPDATSVLSPIVVILAIIGIIYGALVAMVQTDIKRLVAYSSVSHLGFVMLGLFALNHQGLSGAVLQMVNHGLSTGALFLLVGVIYERRHTRDIEAYGGIAASIPVFSTIFLIVTMSSIGLPTLNGFVGEFLILNGAMQASWQWTAWAATGVILSAIYMLWMVQRVFFGPIKHEENRNLKDMNWKELAAVIPLLIFIVWIGIYPDTFLKVLDLPVADLLSNRTGIHLQTLLLK